VQRALGAGDQLGGGEVALRENETADRDGRMQCARRGAEGRRPHRREQLQRRLTGLLGAAIQQHGAEPVRAQAAKPFAADEPREPLGHADEDRVSRIASEGIVHHRHAIDADGEKGRLALRAARPIERTFSDLGQPHAAQAPGQAVMLEALLQSLLAELQVRHPAQGPDHRHRLAGAVDLRLAAIVDPDRAAVRLGEPVVAFIRTPGAEMVGQGGHARRLVARIDESVERIARHRRFRPEEIG
jgi:hypothetical protein